MTELEGEGEAMATVGTKAVEAGEGEAITTVGGPAEAYGGPGEAGVRDSPGPKDGASAEGFHLSAEGPEEVGPGPQVGTVDEGRWPKGGAEGPARGLEATRGGTGSTHSAEGVGTVFFVVGLRMRFRAMRFRAMRLPNTTRASPMCSSVPRIETWHSSRGPDFNV